MSGSSGDRLDDLGWLQFERLSSLLFAAESGREEPFWSGHADRLRSATVDGPLELTTSSIRLEGRIGVFVAWCGTGGSWVTALEDAASRISAELSGLKILAVVVMTNLDAAVAWGALERGAGGRRLVVLGERELGAAVDRQASVRAALPSVLGARDLTALIPPRLRAASSLPLESAQALARVFWPTRAYAHAREVLMRHRFVVLTGPPEMGKTAIAQMLALAQLTDGWEAHECTRPEQVWRVFDPAKRQVFVADDAFGSTEYRPDAAERWALSLGRLLAMLDRDHWLIWTSRPAPLKAGLRRVQRERHAERFPSPGEVLVDAGDLDRAEKTLILFRHAKASGLSEEARALVRSSALTVVEHPHFTPERIRRLVAGRLMALQLTAYAHGMAAVVEDLERELATPTEAMRTSYRALEPEHRELLNALLDAPGGLIDERELAATVRRHRPAGFSRPPGELIDRLTDHFLRVTPLGIGWVHPSWRDLVITELQEAPEERRRFLTACGLYGVMLALSLEGGTQGERTLPLIATDGDWDVLADRLVALTGELEDQELVQLFLALRGFREAELTPAQRREARTLTGFVLSRAQRRFDQQPGVLPAALLEHWYLLRDWCQQPVPAPSLVHTWAELYPGSAPAARLERNDLARLEEWLTVLQILRRHDPQGLHELGYFRNDRVVLARMVADLREHLTPDTRELTVSLLTRIRDLSDAGLALAAQQAIDASAQPGPERQWWVPGDIDAPPSTEPVGADPDADGFTRDDVERVLADL